jgi:hypothetical protein
MSAPQLAVSLMQGLEGVLYDNAAISPAPLPQLDLGHLGPMKLPRVWSAIHDALLYADPRIAAGGRVSTSVNELHLKFSAGSVI